MKLSVHFIMAMILLAACAGSNGTPAAAEPARSERWKLELSTSGGFSGRGAGNYVLDSKGALTLTTMNGSTCSFTLSEEEIARFTQLLAAAEPSSWQRSYAPENRCCDRIEYQLTVNRGGTKHATEWIDDPIPMPRDLMNLWMAITGGTEESLRMKYERQCGASA